MQTSATKNGTTISRAWLTWQLADSAFPTGGFAHSGGLEAAWQHRTVRNSGELADFLETALHQLGRGSLPFVTAGHGSVSPIEPFLKINQLCDAFTSNHVANRSSRLQGQAFLIAAERTFGGEPLKTLRAAFREPDLPAHFAPLFGGIGALLEIERVELANLFMFLHLRGWIASAVRLGIVGPMEGQRTQFQLSDYAASVTRRCSSLTLDDIAQTAPLLDLMQANQDRLYSRLFQS